MWWLVGKVRQIEVSQLWVQDKVRKKALKVTKVDGFALTSSVRGDLIPLGESFPAPYALSLKVGPLFPVCVHSLSIIKKLGARYRSSYQHTMRQDRTREDLLAMFGPP